MDSNSGISTAQMCLYGMMIMGGFLQWGNYWCGSKIYTFVEPDCSSEECRAG